MQLLDTSWGRPDDELSDPDNARPPPDRNVVIPDTFSSVTGPGCAPSAFDDELRPIRGVPSFMGCGALRERNDLL